MTNWQTKKLGELFTFKNGLNKGVEYFGHGTPIVNYVDVNKNSHLTESDINGLVDVTYSEKRNCSAQKGDVFFTRTSENLEEIGLSSVLLDEIEDCVFSGYVLRGRPTGSELVEKYCAYAFRIPQVRKEIKRKSSMTTRALTSGKFLSEVVFSYPEKPEQKRIVGVLEVWDEYIEQLERKIALKEQLKIALMQQIFLRKLRLPGYVNNWREIKLEEAANIERGKSLTSNELVNGLYPVIAGGKTSPYCHAEYTHEDVITVSASGANAGYVAYQPRKIWASDCSVAYARTGDYETLYIYYWLYFMQDRIYGLQTGGAQPHVQPSDLRRLKISVPDKEGQLEIIALLGSVDLEINSLEKMKQQLLLQKKYLLQNLITGKIRTPENMEITR